MGRCNSQARGLGVLSHSRLKATLCRLTAQTKVGSALRCNGSFGPAVARAAGGQFSPALSLPNEDLQEVNAWVSDATNGKITDIVDEATVKEAIMLLINALYFNATWESVFEK